MSDSSNGENKVGGHLSVVPDAPVDPTLEEDTGPPAPSFIVFDVGEVLIDETRVWTVWADLLGVSPFTLMSIIGAAVVQGEPFEAALDFANPNVSWTELEGDHEAAYGGFTEDDLYFDARQCLSDLQEAGFKVAIAGNQPARRTEQLKALDLPYDFLATSDELGAEKPTIAFYDAVMAMIGATSPSEVLYIGDRVDNDIIPAAAYGMLTCWVQRGPWGMLQDAPDELDPDLVLDGLGEIATLLTAWRDE